MDEPSHLSLTAPVEMMMYASAGLAVSLFFVTVARMKRRLAEDEITGEVISSDASSVPPAGEPRRSKAKATGRQGSDRGQQAKLRRLEEGTRSPESSTPAKAVTKPRHFELEERAVAAMQPRRTPETETAPVVKKQHLDNVESTKMPTACLQDGMVAASKTSKSVQEQSLPPVVTKPCPEEMRVTTCVERSDRAESETKPQQQLERHEKAVPKAVAAVAKPKAGNVETKAPVVETKAPVVAPVVKTKEPVVAPVVKIKEPVVETKEPVVVVETKDPVVPKPLVPEKVGVTERVAEERKTAAPLARKTDKVCAPSGFIFPAPRKRPVPRLPVPRGNEGFNVMSYNVLAEHYAQPRFFPYASRSVLRWESRREAIKRRILRELPDVICLQEVQSDAACGQHDHAKWFAKWLTQRGYDGHYGRRMGAAKVRGGPKSLLPPEWGATELRGVQLGLLTMWRCDVFECEESITVPLAVEVSRECQDDSIIERFGRHSQVLVITRLRHKFTDKTLVVGNIHLVAPRGADDHDSKLAQTIQLTAALHSISRYVDEKGGGAAAGRPAVMVAGDFNATPESETYQLLTKGRVDAKQLRNLARNAGFPLDTGFTLPYESPSTDLGLLTTHSALGEDEPTFTNYTEGFKGCLDYISFVPKGLRCVALGDLPCEKMLSVEVALPNSEQPSDHLPVMCRLEFC